MTDTTPTPEYVAEQPSAAEAAPSAAQPTFEPNRPWHKDTASVVALALAGGFVVAAAAFATGWGAHGVADHITGGDRGIARAGFAHPGMIPSGYQGGPGDCGMSGAGPRGGFDGRPGADQRGFDRGPGGPGGPGSDGGCQPGGSWQ